MSERDWRMGGEGNTTWIVKRVYPSDAYDTCGRCGKAFGPWVPRNAEAEPRANQVWIVCHRAVLLEGRFCSETCAHGATDDAEAEYQKRQLVHAIMEG